VLKPLADSERRGPCASARRRGLTLDDAVLDWLFVRTQRANSLTALLTARPRIAGRAAAHHGAVPASASKASAIRTAVLEKYQGERRQPPRISFT
jgi:hypothetical protein